MIFNVWNKNAAHQKPAILEEFCCCLLPKQKRKKLPNEFLRKSDGFGSNMNFF